MGPWVRSGHKETRLEFDPLPFLIGGLTSKLIKHVSSMASQLALSVGISYSVENPELVYCCPRWRSHMQERDQQALEATIHRPRLRAKGDKRGNEKGQDCTQDRHETRLDSDEGSLQGERSVSNVHEHSYHSEFDREIKNLWKQVKELEIEIRG